MSYRKYADKARAKIQKYGAEIIIRRAGKKVYDPKTDTYIDTGREFGGFALQSTFAQKDIDGTNVIVNAVNSFT